ncbi:bacteriocin [Campylobacter hyointestinalis subsp. hyointestinalis]|uniref:Bacteriocin n=1 Tax=Campylobacter hyointestinalis subsp. hyointestinalis TaxID=91352 RepID=A0A0S4SQ89_CAMHY|nr:ATP-binding protein [Campylobacter hyointestinalis]CUU88152.1 bacteriocin [Campylobacter hyointestinalis subsp. hyointestinalis]
MRELYEAYQKGGGSYRKLAALIGEKNHTYVTLAINGWGDYKLSSERKREIEEKVRAFFESQNLKIGSKYDQICERAGIIAFDNTINIIASVIKAIKQQALMKITAKSGTGKTTAVRALLLSIPQSVIVTAYDGMSKKELLEEIAVAVGAKSTLKTQQALMRAIKDQLSHTKKVLIIDEANFMSEKSLEQIRHIQDVSQTAIVLVGTERLDMQIARSHEQVESRVRACLPLRAFGESEVMALFAKDGIKLDEKEASQIWKKCRNLREVKYLLDDLIEIYGGNKSGLSELM